MIPQIKKIILHFFHIYFSLVYCDNPWELIRDLLLAKPMVYQIQGIKIKTRPGNSRTALVLYEVFVKKVYEQKFDVPKSGTIIDIGACIGEFSVYAATKTKGRLVAIEPWPQNVALLKENIRLNSLSNVEVVEAAVASRPGRQNLYLSKIAEGHSLLKGEYTDRSGESIKVKTVSLASLVGEQGIAFLKSDAEGAEGEFIVESADKTLKQISRLALEYHDNSSKYSGEEIKHRLEDVGFKVMINKTAKYYGYIYAKRQINVN